MTIPYISSLHIEYSNLKPVNLTDFIPGINIIYGDNESGKSRIKDFLSWMLFADSSQYSTDKTKNINKIYRSIFSNIDEQIKGEFEIKFGESVSTMFQALNGSKIENRFSPSGLDLRHKLVDGITHDNYSSIYSLSLDEISENQSIAMLSSGEQVEYIFGAIQSKNSTSPTALVSALKSNCEQLFSERESKKEINKILIRIKEISSEIMQFKAESNATKGLDQQFIKLNEEIALNESKLEALYEEQTELKNTYKNIDLYKQYCDLAKLEVLEFNRDIIENSTKIESMQDQFSYFKQTHEDIVHIDQQRDQINNEILILTNRLSSTADPSSIDPNNLSHEFESMLENEIDNERNNKSVLSQLENDIQRLESDSRLLEKQLASTEVQLEIPKNSTTQPSLGKSYKKLFAFISVATFSLITLVGLVLGSSAITAVGATAAIVSLINYFLNGQPRIIVPNTENKFLEINDPKKGLQIKLEHIAEEILSKEDEKQKLILLIETGSNAYRTNCLKVGLPEQVEPNHLKKYLVDFQLLNKYKEDLKNEALKATSLNKRLDEFFASIETIIQDSNFKPEKNIKINSILESQILLNELQQYLKEQVTLKAKHDLNKAELTKAEDKLIENYGDLDNAKSSLSLQSKENIQRKLDELLTSTKELKNKIDTDTREVGAISLQAEQLSKATQIQDLTLEQESLKSELSHLHKKYMTNYISHSVAKKAFSKWKDNYQPEVTKKASEYFSTLTKNKWNSIQTDIDDLNNSKTQSDIFTTKNLDTILSSKKLSRGASEQMFLAFRLAVMQTNSRATHAPVMFDDIAVNFDSERFKALTPLLNEISANRQIFYFTCHKWVRDSLVNEMNAKSYDI